MNQFVFYKNKSPSAGEAEYDHIVSVIGFDSNYDDNLYHPDDVIHISDHGETACIKSKDKTNC